MREILQKELREVLARRGLRARPWAVELDEAARRVHASTQGFTPDLGARPLKRAVERHLLAPLAEAIVEQTCPSGDQFLFVSYARETGITVSFVDLESGDDSQLAPLELDDAGAAPLDLRALALSGRANRPQVHALLGELGGSPASRAARCRSASSSRSRRSAVRASGRRRTASRRSPRPSTSIACRRRRSPPRTSACTSRAPPARMGLDTGNVVSLLALRLLVLRAALDGLGTTRRRRSTCAVRPAEATGGDGRGTGRTRSS